jgi:hypothetical protein
MIIAKVDHKFILHYYGVNLPPQLKWVSYYHRKFNIT